MIDSSTTGTGIDQPLETSGTLTGAGQVSTIDRATRDSIVAALALDPLLVNLERSLPDVEWAYFASERGHIYLVPASDPRNFSYTPALRDRPYYHSVMPEANPDGRARVSDVFEDAAGAGLVTTLSVPVMGAGGVFLGVVAIDVSLAYVRDVISESASLGESSIVDEDGKLVGAPFAFTPGTRAGIPERLLRADEARVDDWRLVRWSMVVLEDELWLVHEADRFDILGFALWRALPMLAALAFAWVLVVLLRRLRIAKELSEQLATEDPLTGALNRRAFDARAAEWLAQSERSGTPVVLMMIDADHFKQVNDTHGHGVGDDVLAGIADCVRATKRPSDQFARFGGEEFVLLAPATDVAGGVRLAERVRERIEQTPLAEVGLRVTVSVGVAELADGEALEACLERADAALYSAKDAGRNRVVAAGTEVAASGAVEQPVAM